MRIIQKNLLKLYLVPAGITISNNAKLESMIKSKSDNLAELIKYLEDYDKNYSGTISNSNYFPGANNKMILPDYIKSELNKHQIPTMFLQVVVQYVDGNQELVIIWDNVKGLLTEIFDKITAKENSILLNSLKVNAEYEEREYMV